MTLSRAYPYLEQSCSNRHDPEPASLASTKVNFYLPGHTVYTYCSTSLGGVYKCSVQFPVGKGQKQKQKWQLQSNLVRVSLIFKYIDSRMEGSGMPQMKISPLFVPVIFFAWSGGILEPELPLATDTNQVISKISHFLMRNLNSEMGPVSTQFSLAPTANKDGFDLHISLQENQDQTYTMVSTDDASKAAWFQVNRLSNVNHSVLLRSQFQGHWDKNCSVDTDPNRAAFIQFAPNGGNPLTAYFSLSTRRIVLLDCEPAECHGRMGWTLAAISSCITNRVREFYRLSDVQS